MNRPPHLAQKMLLLFAGKANIEDIQGDLDEVYDNHRKANGKFKANLFYWGHSFSLIFSYGLKKRKRNTSYSTYYTRNSFGMFRNYLKISLRNLRKQRTFTAINVLGLSIGMSIALLSVAMYVDLKKFDTYHPNAEDIYRVTTEVTKAGDKEKYSSSPPALSHRMKAEIPSIYKSVHINTGFSALISHKASNINAHGYFTEPSFFELFAFPMRSGSPHALSLPGQVILTNELATKLYGNQNPIGKIIESEQWGQLQVGGVLEPFPKHTHLVFDMLVGFPTSDQFNANYTLAKWVDFTNSYFYFAIRETDKKAAIHQLTEIGKAGNQAFEAEDATATYGLQALLNITPGELINDSIGVQFEMPTMLLFFGIALLILLPACFNYTNMSIALALKRAKEVGIRKVMGSQRKPIIYQFLVETIIICLIALLLSSISFVYMRRSFTEMIVGGSALSFELDPVLVLAFIGFAIVTGLLTGLAPALYFAKISPIKALRSNDTSGKVNISGIRKGLLVFQFVLTLIFMIGIGTLLKQYQETKSYELPFSTENTFIVYMQDLQVDLLANELAMDAHISSFSFSSSIPGTSLTKNIYTYNATTQDSLRLREVFVDDRFVDHMNLTLVRGSKLTSEAHQVEHIVVNEEAITRLKRMKFDTSTLTFDDGRRAQIVGVIQNYNHEPLNERIEPLVLRVNEDAVGYAIVSMSGSDPLLNYARLEEKWDLLNPEVPFKASLLENEIYDAYYFFRVGLKIFGFLAILAISISCLGLLGMVIYTTENRRKEVAIRKILGASLQSLFGSLAKLFIRLWVIALIIAVPLSYFFYDTFLIRIYNKFTDGVGLVEILLSVIVTLGLGSLAIFWQVNKVARINPATSLRSE